MNSGSGKFVERALEWMIATDRLPAARGAHSKKALPQIALNAAPEESLAPSDDNKAPGLVRIETGDGPVWLSGNAVMCQCPECEGPVSVRLWLMAADCWNCDTCIELSYEQQQAVHDLTARRTPSDRPLSHVAPPASAVRRSRAPIAVSTPETIAATDERRQLVEVLRQWLHNLPAWLVSLLVHLIILMLLAMIILPRDELFESITLSTAVAPEDIEGGILFVTNPDDPLEFDAPPPPNYREVQNELRDVRIAADQDARELIVDPNPVTTPTPLDKVKEQVTNRQGTAYVLASRDPRLRNEIVEREGGTNLSEAAVARGLRWLAQVQNADGSWSLAGYRDHENPRNRGDAAATSLALLPFLGAGQTHEQGRYRETVARGLKWLMDNQKSDGDLRQGIVSDAGMYAHGQAAIVLVEALAMTGDERFRDAAQRSLDFIERAQHKDGGWRYQPGQPGDTSVLGWQLMALQAARNSGTGLRVDSATLKLASHYLDLAGRDYEERPWRNVPSGTLYRYLPAEEEPSATMTAEAMLCRMYLGWTRDDPRMRRAVNWLLQNDLPSRDEKNIYYWYYATQTMHHFGGQAWETWNEHLRDMLIVLQRRGGKYAGSWDPDEFKYGRSGGRIYVTALAICTLEVYYRHLPLFKQLELE